MKRINLSTWPRRSHLKLFESYAMPYTSLVAPVRATELHSFAKSEGLGLFRPILWAVSTAANAVPELRQRIRGAEVVEHEVVHPSYTTMSKAELFNYCTVPHRAEPRSFFAEVDAENARVEGETDLVPDAPGRDDLLFVSSIPWRSFTALTHPVPLNPADSYPRITWGRAEPDAQGQVSLSLGIMAHHGLVDGVHMARFFEAFEAAAGDIASLW